jgi:hypothetical protein
MAVFCGCLARTAYSATSRQVMLGEMRQSPAATTRTAVTRSPGSVSLTRNPLAPKRSASKRYSSSSKVVRMIRDVSSSTGGPR